jgi:hypothetical protein
MQLALSLIVPTENNSTHTSNDSLWLDGSTSKYTEPVYFPITKGLQAVEVSPIKSTKAEKTTIIRSLALNFCIHI